MLPSCSFGYSVSFLRFLVVFVCVSGPAALQKRSDMCLNAPGLVCASNMLVKMGKTIGQSIRSKHFGISIFWEVLLPALRDEHNS